jgi:hypothetical protein
MAPFAAPAAVAGLTPAQLWQCDDSLTCVYQEPCSTQWNMVPGFAPYSLTPDTAANHFTYRRCKSHHGQGQRHIVCRYCIDYTENEHWFRLADTYFRSKVPAHVENNGRSRYYLTRLCSLCEWREHQLQLQLQHGGAMAPPLPPQHYRNLMAQWPVNTCICLRNSIYRGVRCLQHRREMWDTMRPEFNEQKNLNRRYLINIEKDAAEQRVPSTQATRIHRINHALWRACRCGADPVATVAQAMVMQCMCCEGIVHFGTPPPMVPPPAPHLLRQNSLTTPGLFRFP